MASGCVIGVDLGGTTLLAGAVGADLEVRHRARRVVAGTSDAETLLKTLADAVDETRRAVGGRVDAVGFGIPSLVDQEAGRALATVHLPLQDVPFRDAMEERLGAPVVVDNDANAALLAELRHGAARDARVAAMLTVGTGIGGAIAVDGRLVRGVGGAAGEFGHTVVDPEGPRCGGACPNRGCLETRASAPALRAEARRLAEERPDSALGRALAARRELDGPLVCELAEGGDHAAREAFERIGAWLGIGIANVVNILNPEVVVIGGGVSAAGELLIGPARRAAAERALRPPLAQARIVGARFGAEAGMIGAALMAMERGR